MTSIPKPEWSFTDTPEWNLNAEVSAVRRKFDGSNRIITLMWVYHYDLWQWGGIYAEAKTEYGRVKGRAVTADRMAGEKSGQVSEHKAETQDDVFMAHLSYRKAEQMISADKEALRILHAQLDEWRTNQANEREANRHMAREGT